MLFTCASSKIFNHNPRNNWKVYTKFAFKAFSNVYICMYFIYIINLFYNSLFVSTSQRVISHSNRDILLYFYSSFSCKIFKKNFPQLSSGVEYFEAPYFFKHSCYLLNSTIPPITSAWKFQLSKTVLF